jgi:hypothetical protein
VSETADRVIRTTMRTHWIKVHAREGQSDEDAQPRSPQ